MQVCTCSFSSPVCFCIHRPRGRRYLYSWVGYPVFFAIFRPPSTRRASAEVGGGEVILQQSCILGSDPTKEREREERETTVGGAGGETATPPTPSVQAARQAAYVIYSAPPKFVMSTTHQSLTLIHISREGIHMNSRSGFSGGIETTKALLIPNRSRSRHVKRPSSTVNGF